MLHTNLATRPFYNTRAVWAVLGALGLAVVLVTLFNVVQFIRLRGLERTLGSEAAQVETQAAGLRAEATRIRAQIDPADMAAVASAAREANAIIGQRVFSWTDLLTRFERTLPGDVRITSIQPRIDRSGGVALTITAEGRRVADIEVFLDALDRDGAFREVLAREERTNQDGLIDAVIEAAYTPSTGRGIPAGGSR